MKDTGIDINMTFKHIPVRFPDTSFLDYYAIYQLKRILFKREIIMIDGL